MPKYSIDDDHEWADEKEQERDEDAPPRGEITSHAIEVVDRTADPWERYRYVFEDGEAVGILRDHKLGESSQWDPDGAAKPFQVPGWCRELLEDELGVDSWTNAVNMERCERFGSYDQ